MTGDPVLFEIDQVKPVNNDLTCRTCKHRQRWECGNKIIQYCGVTPSNRTENKLLKIKAKKQACIQYSAITTETKEG